MDMTTDLHLRAKAPDAYNVNRHTVKDGNLGNPIDSPLFGAEQSMKPSVPFEKVFPEVGLITQKAPRQKKEDTKVQLFQESKKYEDFEGREQMGNENYEMIVEEVKLEDVQPLSLEEQADNL